MEWLGHHVLLFVLFVSVCNVVWCGAVGLSVPRVKMI